MARSTASIANEWRALGAQRSDKDAFVRMLAGMDQPSTGYDTPALQGTTAKDGPTPRYNTDPKDAAIYKAQQNWRGIGEAALGVGDVTNDYLNAGIRDIGWLVGNNDPYQFPRPSEAAARLAAETTNTPDIDASKLPPSVQQEAANSRALYGMIPTDVTDVATTAATGAAKLGILHGVPNMFLGPAKADLAAGKSADDIWHDWGWEQAPTGQWWTETGNQPKLREDLIETDAGRGQSHYETPPKTQYPQADQERFAYNPDQGNLFHWAEEKHGYEPGIDTTPPRTTIPMMDEGRPEDDYADYLKRRNQEQTGSTMSDYFDLPVAEQPGLEFLGGIPTRVGRLDTAQGYFVRGNGGPSSIVIRGDANVPRMEETAGHELFHGVASEQGFPSGYNPENPEASMAGQKVKRQLDRAQEAGSRAFVKRTDDYRAGQDRAYEAGDLTYDPVTGKPNYPPGHLSIEDFKKRWGEENPDLHRAIAEGKAATELANKGMTAENLAYETRQGEVAARNSAKRDTGQWTPEQLRLLRPEKTEDVNRAFQWWDNGSTKQSSLPAAAKGDPDDPFFHDVSSIKLDRPIHEMTAQYGPENLPVEQKTLDPQTMLGGVAVPLPGDRTIAGRQLLGINGEPLSSPVNLTGGPNFMRAEQQAGPDRAAWASGQGEISTLAGRVREGERQSDNGNVFLSYMPMAIPGMDFSDMMAKVIQQRMLGAEVGKDDLKAFNDQMKLWRGSYNKKTGQWEYPESQDFPGIEELPDEWIANQPGIQRRKLAQLMDKSAWNKRGFPHIGPIRNALTEPALRDAKSGDIGFSFAKADPGGRIITNPELPHGSYDTQLGGEYVGGFDTPIPKEIMFSTWFGGESDANKANPSNLDYSFRRKRPIQRLDDQWLENIMRHIEQTKRG